MATVVLKEREGERYLPIWVGRPEAIAIAKPLAAVVPPRPLTHDLIVRLVDVSASRVEKMAVTKLHDRTFYAMLWVRVGDRVYEVDARPGDAINLALRMQVPIFVNPVVFARASLSPESVLLEAEARYQSIVHTDDEPELDLRSFRSLL